MTFWIVTALASLIVLAALLGVLVRQRAGGTAAGAEFDIRVYRDQLREVERDLARGVIAPEEGERLRVEVSRRLLEADKAGKLADTASGAAPRKATLVAAGLVAAGVLGGSFWLYTELGAPGYPDLPLAERIAQAERAREVRPGQSAAEAEMALRAPPPPEDSFDPAYLDLVARLRVVVAERPEDIRGHQLLARQEAGMGRYAEAALAQARFVQLKGDAATANDLADLADMMVLAAGGYVSPEAEAVLNEALTRDRANGVARYYTGLMFAQTGRPDLAFRVWSTLLAESGPEAPWQAPIRAQIEMVAVQAGVDYVPPALDAEPLRGPSAEQVEAAGAMSAADRMAMIEGMVEGLSARLASDGGPPEDWARLIRAYGVLGRTDAAAAIWAEAQTVFPDDAARVTILQAARDAGVAN